MSKSLEANASKVTTEVRTLISLCMNHNKRVPQTSKFARSAQVYQKSASERLATMRKATGSLVEQGGREDLPTGSTPRKRAWQFPDSWELTKDRDTIIQGWKQSAVQSPEDGSDSESSTAPQDIPQLPTSNSLKQHPLPSDVVQSDDSEPPDPSPPPYLEADPEQPRTSNLPLPLASSVVPTIALSSVVSNPAMKAKIVKAGSDVVPAKGTLTERSTNLIYSRGARRAR